MARIFSVDNRIDATKKALMDWYREIWPDVLKTALDDDDESVAPRRKSSGASADGKPKGVKFAVEDTVADGNTGKGGSNEEGGKKNGNAAATLLPPMDAHTLRAVLEMFSCLELRTRASKGLANVCFNPGADEGAVDALLEHIEGAEDELEGSKSILFEKVQAREDIPSSLKYLLIPDSRYDDDGGDADSNDGAATVFTEYTDAADFMELQMQREKEFINLLCKPVQNVLSEESAGTIVARLANELHIQVRLLSLLLLR
jgi:hypothetical protein